MDLFCLGNADSALLFRCHYTCVQISSFYIISCFPTIKFVLSFHDFKHVELSLSAIFFNRNLIVIICISYAKKIWTKGILHFKSHPFVAWKLTLHERKSNSGEIIRYSIFKQEFIDLPIHCGPCYWACAFMNFSCFWITW